MTEAMDKYLRELDLYSAGEQDGLERGIKQNQCDIVLNMYNHHFDLKSISEISKLSIDKINDIIKSNKNDNI